jgi:hypothetical protein
MRLSSPNSGWSTIAPQPSGPKAATAKRASTGGWRRAPGWVRTSLCAWPFGALLLVEHKRLVAFGAAQLHTRVVYRQRFAVG